MIYFYYNTVKKYSFLVYFKKKQSISSNKITKYKTPKSLKKLIKFSFKKVLTLMTSTESSLLFKHIIGIKKTKTD